jgi:DNA-binding NarL/FixJ family response regulator
VKTGYKRKKKGVLVVDDHPIVRQGILSILEQEPDLTVCAEAESTGEALKAIKARKPDIAVIDISLKGADGLELTKAIRTQYPGLPVLIMSMHDESLYAERVLRAGANGYIMKQEVSDKIVDAIRQVLNNQVYVSEEVRQRILLGMRGHPADTASAPVQRLSDRELEVFRLIGRGYGTRQVAQQLFLSIKTIETYRAHIKDKLGLDNATELVRFAVQWVQQQDST